MKRRNFFATLFAPLIARWMPKPKSIIEVVNDGLNSDWDGSIPDFKAAADTERKLLLLKLGRILTSRTQSCDTLAGWTGNRSFWESFQIGLRMHWALQS